MVDFESLLSRNVQGKAQWMSGFWYVSRRRKMVELKRLYVYARSRDMQWWSGSGSAQAKTASRSAKGRCCSVIGPVPDLEAFLMRDPCHARPKKVPVKRKASPMIRWMAMVTSEFEANRWQEGNVRLREGNMVTSSQKKEWLRTDCIW